MLRPEQPSVFEIPEPPSPPGAGVADVGPGAHDHNAWHNFLEIFLAIFAWIFYLGQVVIYLISLIPAIIASGISYPVRDLLYVHVELPLYNAWAALHWYLAMTGFVYPMQQEINDGMVTLGLGIGDVWGSVQAALDDLDGPIQAQRNAREDRERLHGDVRRGDDRHAGRQEQPTAEEVEQVRTSEDVVVSKVGRELYEKFFRGYTRKQWGVDPSELDKSVTARVPVRINRDDRYFSDEFQFMPAAGYTRMFERMLDHPNIHLMLQTDYREIRDAVRYKRVIFTGPIDQFFDYRFGKLPYRSLRFEHVTLDKPWHQPVAVVNCPQTHDYTRVTEYKHLTGQEHALTSLTYEYPSAEGDPYYPVPQPQNAEIYKRYEQLALAEEGVWFVGRLATYRYYNMDQVVGQALATFRRIDALPRVDSGSRTLRHGPRQISGELNPAPASCRISPG